MGAIMSPERYDEAQARQKNFTTIDGSYTCASFKYLKRRIFPPIAATSWRKGQRANQGKFYILHKTESKQTFLRCTTGRFSVWF